ncbi:hypothetical protein CLV56_2264 [Mumia flava]|uniref:Uncharacterized protein n=1 Tax=Mumia flava TaxID=1348852 RepID=A0A0B2BVE5_9ACTN|nr:hypothetical protein [Mumia flava]PJJ58021.1 hypothetical protein CLV56_2264 [Mumia flava]
MGWADASDGSDPDDIWRVERPWREAWPVVTWVLGASVAAAAGVTLAIVAMVAILLDSVLESYAVVLALIVGPLALARVWLWTRRLGSVQLVAEADALTVWHQDDAYGWSMIAEIDVIGPRTSPRLRQLVDSSPGFGQVSLKPRALWGDDVVVTVMVTRPDTMAGLVDFLSRHAEPRGIPLRVLSGD